MIPIVILLAFATFVSTLIGGSVALKFKNYLPYFFAFAAGSLIAVAFLDILPESIALAQSIALPVRDLMITLVFSFLFYSFLERFFLTHHHHTGSDEHGHIMGPIGAGSLVIHSFLDGVAIGTAYIVSPSVGLIVALAVIFHDFTDGINTVTVMFRNKQNNFMTSLFLLLDALAPVAGVLITYLIVISQLYLALILALFSGEFLYIGASSLLPETYKHNHWRMMFFMSFGIILILILTSFI